MVEDSPGQRGDGGIGAFSAAGKAAQMEKMKSLSDNDFAKAKAGLIPVSQEPRAVKRRVLAACKNEGMLSKVVPKIDSKTCINRVMSGEIDFMNSVIKDLPNEELIPLVKVMGGPP